MVTALSILIFAVALVLMVLCFMNALFSFMDWCDGKSVTAIIAAVLFFSLGAWIAFELIVFLTAGYS